MPIHSHYRDAARRSLLPLVLLVAACPGKDGILTDFFETSETSTTDSGTGTSITTDISVTGTTSTGEPEVCEDPSVAEVGPEVTVTVRNAGTADIFVRGHGFCGDPAFTVTNTADEPLGIWLAGSCPPLCGDVLASGECGCSDIGCSDGVIRIVPGGSYADSWSGAHYTTTNLSATCVGEDCAGQACSVRHQAEAGTYTLTAVGGPASACMGEDCECEPNAEGWCIPLEAALEPTLTVEAALAYPGDGAIELVFE